jgi:hypothetical protein
MAESRPEVPTFGHLWMANTSQVTVDLHDDGQERTIRFLLEDPSGLKVWGPVIDAPKLIQTLGEAETWREGRAAV